ncbi:hypothetical protein PLICRDRAFT_53481 [Plicaturopsis crispa FD-325 SS-3]|nr:hypothetical protein PLICRDRAFT_53481 [Plicaturopsis crispa FD-325 SS-3]
MESSSAGGRMFSDGDDTAPFPSSSRTSPLLDNISHAVSNARATSRPHLACIHCKSLKVRCEFREGERECIRCQQGNHACVARHRKRRKAAPTHEDLLEKSHQQDQKIEELLHRIDLARSEDKIRNLIAKSQDSSLSRSMSEAPGHSSKYYSPQDSIKSPAELAVLSYFSNGDVSSQHLPAITVPDVVKHCDLYPADILELFTIFFHKVQPYVSILDPVLHTPANLIWSSPFLFTVIIALASRYHTRKPALHSLAIEFAWLAAVNALTVGRKSVEICQALLLLSVYPAPQQKRLADDKSWVLMGVATRMAMELGLNQLPSDGDEREQLNRARTWLNCWCADISHATQFGKIPTLQLDDYMARHSRYWYKSSRHNIDFDIYLCAHVEFLMVTADFRSAVRDSQGDTLVQRVIEYDRRILSLLEFWLGLYARDSNWTNPICVYRSNTGQMAIAYLRLVILSVGFQSAVKTGLSNNSYIVQESINAAQTTIQTMVNHMYPTVYLRYALEAHFLYVAFAAAFLINLTRPRLQALIDGPTKARIVAIVHQLIHVLGSDEVALDNRHTPALYARFLWSLLVRHGLANPSAETAPQDETLGLQARAYSWPDTSHVSAATPAAAAAGDGSYVYQLSGEADMDFSIERFRETLSPTTSSIAYDAVPFSQQYESAPGQLAGVWSEPSATGAQTSEDAQLQHLSWFPDTDLPTTSTAWSSQRH